MMKNIQYTSLSQLSLSNSFDLAKLGIGYIKEKGKWEPVVRYGFRILQTVPGEPNLIQKITDRLGLKKSVPDKIVASELILEKNIAEQLAANAKEFRIFSTTIVPCSYKFCDDGSIKRETPSFKNIGGAMHTPIINCCSEIFKVMKYNSDDILPEKLPTNSYLVIKNNKGLKGSFVQ